MKYGLNTSAEELSISKPVSGGTTVKTHDTKWLLEPVGAATENASGATYQRPLRLKLTAFNDGLWATSFCVPYDITLPEGVDAYTSGTREGVEGGLHYHGTLTLNKIDGTIPAGTPVIVKTQTEKVDQANGNTIIITVPNQVATKRVDDGFFKVQYMTGEVDHTFINKEKVGVFGKSAGNPIIYLNASRNYDNVKDNHFLAHHKMYVIIDDQVVQQTGAKGLTLVFDDTVIDNGEGDATGIDEVENENSDSHRTVEDDTIYDIQGRKVERITKPGIYIRNGKKFVVRRGQY